MIKSTSHGLTAEELSEMAPPGWKLGKTPKGFELQIIEISSVDDSDEVYKCDILAFIYKGLAIHKTSQGWHLTHIESGKLLARVSTKVAVVKGIKYLADCFDWHLTEAALRHRVGCEKAVMAVRNA